MTRARAVQGKNTRSAAEKQSWGGNYMNWEGKTAIVTGASGCGTIINMTSVVTHKGYTLQSVYAHGGAGQAGSDAGRHDAAGGHSRHRAVSSGTSRCQRCDR